jgi:hypothetical protein
LHSGAVAAQLLCSGRKQASIGIAARVHILSDKVRFGQVAQALHYAASLRVAPSWLAAAALQCCHRCSMRKALGLVARALKYV